MAVTTQAQELDGVGDGSEAVIAGCPVCPAVDRRCGDFHGVAALAADQVVVVFLAVAAPVPGLALGGPQYVHFTLTGHGLQGAVDRGEGDPFPVFMQQMVQLLGAAESCRLLQHVVERHALPGHPFHARFPPGS